MPVFLLSLSLLLQAPAPPASDQVGRAYTLFLQGRALDQADQIDQAIARYREALQILPDSATIYAELATLYARQEKIPEARASADRALALDPANRVAHRILGLVQASQVRTTPADATGPLRREAIGHLERALANNVQDLGAQLTLGDLYLRNGQTSEAIATLQAFLEERPGYPQAMMLLVDAYRAAGKTAEATALLAEMQPRGSGLVGSRLLELEELESRGRWREAAAGWAALADRDPDTVEYRLRQATALAGAGGVDEARQVLAAVTTRDPREIDAWDLLARIEQRAGRTQAAEEAAQRIIQIDPADPRGPLALAEIRAARMDYRGVIGALEPRVLTTSPADLASGAYAEMASMLADAWLNLKDKGRAVAAVEGAYQRAPKDDRVLFTLAATYERAGQIDRAERSFRQLIAHDPTHARALNYLGYMLANNNRKLADAVEFITRALAEEPDNPAYLDSLGWAYYRLQQFQLALSPLEKAAAAVPESSVIQDHLGDLYVKLERYSDAAAAFDRVLAGDGDGVIQADIEKKRDRARSKVKTP
jgi:tetratricopeptide (TPR) repeat protein